MLFVDYSFYSLVQENKRMLKVLKRDFLADNTSIIGVRSDHDDNERAIDII